MRLLASIPLALLGSLLGSALRSGLKVAEERMDASPDGAGVESDLNVSGSLIATAAGGLAGILFGTGTAFWTGVALGAAGIERFDFRLLKIAGVDVDTMVARAMSMADQARRGDSSLEEAGQQPAAGASTDLPAADQPA